MQAHRNVVLLIVALAFVGLFAGAASGQEPIAKDARFTLPFTASWMDTVLPPGNYTLCVNQVSPVAYTVSIAGEGRLKMILSFKSLRHPTGKESKLVTERRGGKVSIRGIQLPYADLLLTFPPTKAEREILAKAPAVVQPVPILVAAK
jgi:hypothetical protein